MLTVRKDPKQSLQIGWYLFSTPPNIFIISANTSNSISYLVQTMTLDDTVGFKSFGHYCRRWFPMSLRWQMFYQHWSCCQWLWYSASLISVNTFPWSTRHTPWRPLHPAELLKSLIMPLKYGQCKYSSGLSLACPHALCTTKHKVTLWLGVQFWKPSWCRGLCKLKAVYFMKLNIYILNLSGNQTILSIILTFYFKFQATIIPLSFKTWNIFMWTF